MRRMEYRELAETGIMLPEVGLGTWRYRGGAAPLVRGIELGANLIDTAEIYGSEGVVGEALQGRREGVFLATKVSGEHLKPDQVRKAADQSLKRLGVSVIDLYQVHWPNPRVPIEQTMQALEELVDTGKVRYIGVSNFSRSQVEQAQAALKRNRIVSNQLEYHLLDRSIEADFDFYSRERILVIAYSPLAEGRLVSTRTRGYDVIEAVAQEAGKTPAQVVLNWCLVRPNVITIPKSDREARVEENCGASGWRLEPAHVARLEAAFPV